MAIHIKVGWVLSGPADHQETTANLALTATHALSIDTFPVKQNLDDQLRRFWEFESLGIMKDESSVYSVREVCSADFIRWSEISNEFAMEGESPTIARQL